MSATKIAGDEEPQSIEPRLDGATSEATPSRPVREGEGRSGGSSGLFSLVSRLFGGGRGEGSLRETLEELIEEHVESDEPLSADERAMLHNILNFGELRTDDVMVPRADIDAVEASAKLDDLIALFREAGHTRVPVYRDALDNVIGMVHLKDLLPYWSDGDGFQLRDIMRDVLFVPPSMSVRDLLVRMRVTRIHMAVVVDEFGGTDGLVTIEDLVEEIVGEIQDEHDEDEEELLIDRGDGLIEADARAEIEDFEAMVDIDLLPEEEDEEVDTLGGLVMHLLGRMPQRGEVVRHPSGIEFEVVDADPRRVKRLRVRLKGMEERTES